MSTNRLSMDTDPWTEKPEAKEGVDPPGPDSMNQPVALHILFYLTL